MKTFKYKILKVKLEDMPEELLSHFPLLDMGREGWRDSTSAHVYHLWRMADDRNGILSCIWRRIQLLCILP